MRRYRFLVCVVVLMGLVISLQGVHAQAEECIQPTPILQLPCPGPVVLPHCIEPPVQGVKPICIEPGDGGGGPGPDPCVEISYPGGDQQGHGGQPMCLPGPASCVAVDVAVKVNDPTGLTGGVDFQLSRSTARADSSAFNGSGGAQGDSDAAQHKLNVPPVLGEGIVESECHAVSQTSLFCDPIGGCQGDKDNHAYGQADVTHFHVDLSPYTMPLLGMPLTIRGDVLCEQGASKNGTAGPLWGDPALPLHNACVPDPDGEAAADPGASATGANRADIVNLIINGAQIIPAGLTSVAPNTSIDIPPALVPPLPLLATVYLNEQGVSNVFFCSFYPLPVLANTYWGDALRIVVWNPITALPLASVTISYVATTTCDP